MAITSVDLLLDWIGLADADGRASRTSFLKEMGKPRFIRQLVAVPWATYTLACAALKVEVTAADDSVTREDLNPIEEGQVGEVRRIARMVMNLAPEAEPGVPLPPALGVGTAPSTSTGYTEMAKAIRDAVRPPSKKIIANKVLDQGDDTEVLPLDAKVLSDLINDWKVLDNDDEEPAEDEEATADQMAVLSARLDSGATPFADFGVFRPFGNRMERAMKFVIHTPQPDGTSRPKEVSGPTCFKQWLRCWKVFVFAMGTLKAATKTRLARYAERIRSLDEDYPNHWWIIGLADIKMRSEGIERIRRQCKRRKAAGDLADFDESRPWDVAFREAAANTDYWYREVDRQIVLKGGALRSSAKIKDLGTGPIEEVTTADAAYANKRAVWNCDSDSDGGDLHGDAAKKKRKRPRGGKATREERAAKKSKAAPQADRPPPTTVNLAKANEKSADGKYLRDESGKQICWGYRKGNCPTPCKSGRAHVCEWCRGSHTTAECRKQR